MHTKVRTSHTTLTRRQFLRGATLSTAAFMVVPASVLGLRGATSPSGKLNLPWIVSDEGSQIGKVTQRPSRTHHVRLKEARLTGQCRMAGRQGRRGVSAEQPTGGFT